MKTMKEKCLLKNDDGSVLVLTLVMVVLLTLLGISASRTSSIEIQISGNDKVYKQNLYKAEAAAMEGAQRMQDANPNPRDDTTLTWLNQTMGAVDEGDVVNSSDWTGLETPPIAGIEGSQLLAGFDEIVGSLDMGKSNIYKYTIYGRGQGQGPKGGLVIIGVGYKRAF